MNEKPKEIKGLTLAQTVQRVTLTLADGRKIDGYLRDEMMMDDRVTDITIYPPIELPPYFEWVKVGKDGCETVSVKGVEADHK